MAVHRLVVLGAGLMGHGIAQIAAQNAHCLVRIVDIRQEFLEQGMNMIRRSLEHSVEKGAINRGDVVTILGRIKPTTDLAEAVSDVDFVIEAASGNENLKMDTFKKLDEMFPRDVCVASNTSSISITLPASATNRPERICGRPYTA